MFGGWAWPLHGNLLCGARRVAACSCASARPTKPGPTGSPASPPPSWGRISGWVRATPEAYGNDALRQKLIEAALDFTGSLPKKEKQ
jgi:hypothetical protein